MKQITALRDLGYRVEEAMHYDTDEFPTTWFVEGPGVRTYIKEGDADAWASLVDTHTGRELWEQLSHEDRQDVVDGSLDVHELADLSPEQRAQAIADVRATASR